MKKVIAVAATGIVAAGALVAASPAANAASGVGSDVREGAWVYGNSYRQHSMFCFSSAFPRDGDQQRLQLRDARGAWRTVASSTTYRRADECDPATPYRVVYRFNVSELGKRLGGARYRVQAREVLSTGEKESFTKVVWASADERDQGAADYAGSLLDNLLESPQDAQGI